MGTAARTTLPRKRYDLASTPVSGSLLAVLKDAYIGILVGGERMSIRAPGGKFYVALSRWPPGIGPPALLANQVRGVRGVPWQRWPRC